MFLLTSIESFEAGLCVDDTDDGGDAVVAWRGERVGLDPVLDVVG
jgi:hypothetical protein